MDLGDERITLSSYDGKARDELAKAYVVAAAAAAATARVNTHTLTALIPAAAAEGVGVVSEF